MRHKSHWDRADRTRVCEVDNRRLPAHHKVFLSDTATNHTSPRAHIHSSAELPREPIPLLTKKGVKEAGGAGVLSMPIEENVN